MSDLFRDVFFNRLARNPDAISDDDLAQYVRSYASPEQLRAGLEFYRAYPENERFNAAQREHYTIRDGILYDARALLRDMERIVTQVQPRPSQ